MCSSLQIRGVISKPVCRLRSSQCYDGPQGGAEQGDERRLRLLAGTPETAISVQLGTHSLRVLDYTLDSILDGKEYATWCTLEMGHRDEERDYLP